MRALRSEFERRLVLDARVGKERLQAIVILVQDRIELVIVTPGASIRQAEEGGRHRVGDVVQKLLPALHEIACIALVGEMAIESGGDQSRGIVGVKLVARDLLAHEAVVRLVLIERCNDIVAIAPDVGAGLVEPVARPALAVMGRGEQSVHHLGKRVRRIVGDERLHFFGRGYQTR